MSKNRVSKLYNLTEVFEISKTLVHKYYPNATCAILTGSQTEEAFVSLVSDIDILIIDPEFCGVSSEAVRESKHNIDFTRVGLWNLVEVLVDSCYSKSNTIMNMIISGYFIQDMYNIEKSLKRYCRRLFSGSNVNYFSEYKNIRRQIIMLRKHFLKELRDEEIPLTLSDFLLEITRAYLFFHYNGKYGLNGYRRSKLLHKTKKDFNFLRHVNKLSTDYLKTKNNSDIIYQLESFLSYSLLNTKKIQDFRYIVNIQFPRENGFNFYLKIIGSIVLDDFLKEKFMYGKKVQKNSIFNDEYVLVFNNRNGVDDYEIVSRLNKTIKSSSMLKIRNVDAFYLRENWFDLNYYFSCEPIFRAINNVVITIIKDEKKYNPSNMIPTFVYIVLKCIHVWEVSVEDIKHTLFLIREKHRPLFYYKEINHNEIHNNNQIIKNLDLKFTKENLFIIKEYAQYIEAGLFFKHLERECPSLKKIAKSIEQAKASYIAAKGLPEHVEILFKHRNNNLFHILIFLEFSLMSMGLNIRQRATTTIFTLNLINHVKKVSSFLSEE